jgi:hypothetical protein
LSQQTEAKKENIEMIKLVMCLRRHPDMTRKQFQDYWKNNHGSFFMRIVIDTNVLVASLRSRRGAPFKLLSVLPGDKFSIAISISLVLEYENALKRLESSHNRC